MSDYKPHPLRVQRRKGERLKPCECWVGDGRWGDPFASADEFEAVFRLVQQSGLGPDDYLSPRWQVVAAIVRDIKQLRGFKLACDCPLDRPCHADTLAELANK